MSKLILPCTYLGPTDLYSDLIRAEEVEIEMCEHYVKQTYRNRCTISTGNGLMDLTIPVARPYDKIQMKDIKIAYEQDWQKLHWKAIESAYRMSPYFEYLAEDFEPIFKTRETYLVDFNMKLHEKVMLNMQLKKDIATTTEYKKETGSSVIDKRMEYSPKKERKQCKPYHQVFENKYGFETGLSIFDLLMNEGPESIFYL